MKKWFFPLKYCPVTYGSPVTYCAVTCCSPVIYCSRPRWCYATAIFKCFEIFCFSDCYRWIIIVWMKVSRQFGTFSKCGNWIWTVDHLVRRRMFYHYNKLASLFLHINWTFNPVADHNLFFIIPCIALYWCVCLTVWVRWWGLAEHCGLENAVVVFLFLAGL